MALLQTLVRGSAEPSLGTMYIDVSFPQPSSSPRLGILVTTYQQILVLLTEPSHYSKTVQKILPCDERAKACLGKLISNTFVAAQKNQPGRPTLTDRPQHWHRTAKDRQEPDAGTVLLRTRRLHRTAKDLTTIVPIRLQSTNPTRPDPTDKPTD